MRRLLLAIAALAIAGGIVFWFITVPARIETSSLPPHPRDVDNGKAMFLAGGCASCHAPNQEDRTRLAGGVALKSPFGTFYSPNISPDPKDGIGRWSEADFVTAMWKGTSPDGKHYYPAFPYASYQRMREADVRDFFAYLKTLPAVEGSARDHDLPLPFKLRRIVGDLRSGLISTTISLSLMNILSESVERAVLFLVRKDELVALGAFGNSPGGQPLAQLSRGLKLGLSSRNALTDSLADGRVRSITFEEARLPENIASLFGRPRSGECAIFPVMGGQRVIALVYADNGHSNRAIEELDILELAAAQAGLAFENELLRRQATQTH